MLCHLQGSAYITLGGAPEGNQSFHHFETHSFATAIAMDCHSIFINEMSKQQVLLLSAKGHILKSTSPTVEVQQGETRKERGHLPRCASQSWGPHKCRTPWSAKYGRLIYRNLACLCSTSFLAKPLVTVEQQLKNKVASYPHIPTPGGISPPVAAATQTTYFRVTWPALWWMLTISSSWKSPHLKCHRL